MTTGAGNNTLVNSPMWRANLLPTLHITEKVWFSAHAHWPQITDTVYEKTTSQWRLSWPMVWIGPIRRLWLYMSFTTSSALGWMTTCEPNEKEELDYLIFDNCEQHDLQRILQNDAFQSLNECKTTRNKLALTLFFHFHRDKIES